MAKRRPFPSKKTPCPIEVTIGAIGGRWKVLILRELFLGMRRFGQLHRSVAGVTFKMLTQQLRELEAAGLIQRKVHAQVPPRVDYSLTACGRSLEPVLLAMEDWGERHGHAGEGDGKKGEVRRKKSSSGQKSVS